MHLVTGFVVPFNESLPSNELALSTPGIRRSNSIQLSIFHATTGNLLNVSIFEERLGIRAVTAGRRRRGRFFSWGRMPRIRNLAPYMTAGFRGGHISRTGRQADRSHSLGFCSRRYRVLRSMPRISEAWL